MTRRLWPLLTGFGIWSLGFVALYALQALGCVWHWPESAHRLALLTIWLVTLALLALWLMHQRHSGAGEGDTLLRRCAMLATLAAIAASVLTFFPLVFTSLCI